MEIIFTVSLVQNHTNAPLSCVLLYYSVVCCGLCHPLQSSTASVCCFPWQSRWLLAGECKGMCWKGKCHHRGSCGEDKCMGVFVWNKVAVMQNYLWTPNSVENIPSVHLHISHVPLNVTNRVLNIRSSPISAYCVKYMFYIWSFWFLSSTFVWVTCTQCSKSNCTKIILRSQGDRAYLQVATSTVTECTPVLETVIHHI